MAIAQVTEETGVDIAEFDDKAVFTSAVEERRKELESTFSYDGYRVVRKELFAHMRDPAVTIRPDSITFNTACIAGLEDVVYVQISINEELKRITVEGCNENDKDALRWCVAKPDKRRSRKMTCRDFSDSLYELMGWDKSKRYKVLGYRIEFEGKMLYVFDLTVPEEFNLRSKKRSSSAGNVNKEDITYQSTNSDSITADSAINSDANEKNINNIDDLGNSGTEVQTDSSFYNSNTEAPSDETTSRRGSYSDEIKKSFGVPVAEHRKETEITDMNGYVSFGMITGRKEADSRV